MLFVLFIIDSVRRLRRFRKEWLIKTPQQKWLLIYDAAAMMSKLIGITVYGDMKIYWYSFFLGFVGAIHYSTVFYTRTNYFVKGEYAKSMQCTWTIGIVVSVSLFKTHTLFGIV